MSYSLILFYHHHHRHHRLNSKPQTQIRKKRKLNGQQRDEATIREKHRMLKLNKAYSLLRLVLPVENKCKLSRIETLRTAVNYIQLLSQLLEVDNNNQHQHHH